MSKEKKLRVLLIILAVIIISVWVIVILTQNQNTSTQLKEEKLHNLLYLDILKKAIINNIIASETIEDLLLQKLNVINSVVDDSHFPDSTELKKWCKENSFYEISFVDFSNNIITSNLKEEKYPYDLSVLDLQINDQIIFEITDELSGSSKNLYLIRKEQDYYFVGAIGYNEIRTHTQEISLSRMIEFVETSLEKQTNQIFEHTKYIVIQDTIGIISATRNITSLNKIENDEFLERVYRLKESNSRIIHFQNEPLLETVSPFYIEGYDFGIIRLGSSLTRLEIAEKRKFFIILILSFILLASLFLEYVFYKNFNKLRKSTEELNSSRRMLEIAKLGGEVAHEIKNPLNSIFMILQRVRNEFKVKVDQEEYVNLLDVSFNEIDRLNKIIERFLSFTRTLEISTSKVNVCKIIDDITNLFAEQAANEKVSINWECEEHLVASLDEKKIKQVMINIIKNAFESFPDISVGKEIKIETRIHKDSLIIMVADNGKGIEQGSIPLIWDLYYTTKEKGNGIGLAVSKKIIEAHNGTISVTSHVAKGTRFVINLPVSKKEADENIIN